MTEKLRSHLTTAYMMFIFDFHDPIEIDKSGLEQRMPCKIKDLFSSQRNCDKAKKKLDKDFPKALSLYFVNFQAASGVDFVNLYADIEKNQKTMQRHLGKEKLAYIRLIVELLRLLDEPKQKIKGGLLSEYAA